MIIDTSAVIAVLQREDPHAEHAAAAHRAYLQYGMGRHPAALNYRDTMTYAAAKLANEPLIAVGDDFAQTDLEFDGVVGYWPHPAIGRH